ncbi:MAG: transcription antitermination factor NusB [Weeksellaceae bacterium]
MLGRRQLREKTMQALYVWKMNGKDANVRIIEKNLINEVDQIYDLYIYLLNLLKFLKTTAEEKIEVGKNKNLPSAEELNPNMKFVNNRIFGMLESNEELNNYTSKNMQLTWNKLENKCPSNIFNAIISSPEYKSYMNSGVDSFNEDKAFLINIYAEYIAPNEELADWLEEKSIYWVDDMHIGNSMVQTTLESFIPISQTAVNSFKLFKVFKDDDDRKFLSELFRRTIRYNDETEKIITEKATNWEADRIAVLDFVILQMALTEFMYFSEIPPKVTLNEYIELSKVYSTEKSKIFVNGILDRSLKDLKRNLN